MRSASRDEVFRLHAQICKALSDPSRLLLIVALGTGPRTVGDLAQAIGASQPLTSRHLGVLRDKGIVRADRDGAFVRYSLTDPRILAAIDILLDVLGSQLARLSARGTALRRLRPVRLSSAAGAGRSVAATS
jgi:DNA-binding transcriptional ArsR family regulator